MSPKVRRIIDIFPLQTSFRGSELLEVIPLIGQFNVRLELRLLSSKNIGAEELYSVVGYIICSTAGLYAARA